MVSSIPLTLNMAILLGLKTNKLINKSLPVQHIFSGIGVCVIHSVLLHVASSGLIEISESSPLNHNQHPLGWTHILRIIRL